VDDAELVARCVAREPAAWDEIVRRHVALLHAVVARVLKPRGPAATDPETEDVVQVVYLKLWEDGCRRLRTFEGRSRLSTWLAVLARREALDRIRGRGAGAGAVPGVFSLDDAGVAADVARNGHIDRGVTAEAAFASREERETLLAGVDALPPRDRLLVRLVHLDGCSYGEVARLLAVPENSISPWLARARDRLRALIATPRGVPAYGTPLEEPLKGRSETP
jgi:RNA polymerase sigma-70 factor, ECF subfamily